MANKRVIAVIGATGAQGGGLCNAILKDPAGGFTCRAITRDPRFANVPVIMCTSKNQETDKVWGMRQGARDYIVKPVDPTELMAKIRAFD